MRKLRKEEGMRTGLVLAATCAAFLLVGLQSAAGAGEGNVTCTDFFAGTAYDLTVPADNFCELSGATITHDLIVESNAGVGAHDGVTVGHDAIGQTESEFDATQLAIAQDLITQTGASLFLANTTVGRDLVASQPHTVQTGSACAAECESGPVKVGRDVLISGSPTPHAFAHDLCDMTVGRDLRVTDVTVLFGFTIGDIGPDEGCSRGGQPRSLEHDRPRSRHHRQHGPQQPVLRALGHGGGRQQRWSRPGLQRQHRRSGRSPRARQQQRRSRRDLRGQQPAPEQGRSGRRAEPGGPRQRLWLSSQRGNRRGPAYSRSPPVRVATSVADQVRRRRFVVLLDNTARGPGNFGGSERGTSKGSSGMSLGSLSRCFWEGQECGLEGLARPLGR
jgi:hypothetical protein